VDRHGDGELVFKAGPLAILLPALALASTDAGGTDRISLTCSGTVSSNGHETPLPSLTITIDLNQHKVTGALGQFSVTESTESTIWFRGAGGGGMFDRKSGLVNVTEAFGTPKTYQLTCK
jgi:hypothetical protein